MKINHTHFHCVPFLSLPSPPVQTNLYPNGRKRRIRPFEGMIRKAVVIVPSEEEATNRAKNQTKVDSLEVAEAAMGEMRGRVNNKIQMK